MIIWIDAQLSPEIATWIATTLSIETKTLRELGLRNEEDEIIFDAARQAGNIILLSKDIDFVKLIESKGSPPFLIWLTCGNTSNAALKEILLPRLGEVLDLIEGGEQIVEISGE